MSDRPATDFPNIVCPNCGTQFSSGHLSRQNFDSFEKFTSSLSCQGCREDLHPENAVLEYLSRCESNELILQPLSIGGHILAGTITVDTGHTREEGISRSVQTTASIGDEEIASAESYIPYEIGTAFIFETDHEEEVTTQQMVGEPILPSGGPLPIENDTIVVDVGVVIGDDGHHSLGFITSIRDESAADEVTFGYYASTSIPSLERATWPELLRESVEVIYNGSTRSPYSLAIAAFDNAVSRQLRRSLKSQGATESNIEDFFNRHSGWKDRVKQGLEEITGERLSTHSHQLYQEIHDIRTERSGIVHVGADGDLPVPSTADASDDINKVIEGITTIYEICRDSN